MTSEKLRLFQQRLEALQWELLAAKDAAQDSTKPVALDQASVGRLSRMDAMQSQAMAIETQRRRDIHLQRVREALARVQADEYGICPVCDEDIDVRRLNSDPAAILCIGCASRQEMR